MENNLKIGYLGKSAIKVDSNLNVVAPNNFGPIKETIETLLKNREQFVISDLRVLNLLADNGLNLDSSHIEKSIRPLAVQKGLTKTGNKRNTISFVIIPSLM